jgi:redox-sensitive bicupin YhaK (pirin superfamily)
MPERHRMLRRNQADTAEFKAIVPEQIQWHPFDAFPGRVRIAILVGHPSEPGPYVVRIKVPAGTKIMPHRNPQDRIYTVMSGELSIGRGEKFDEASLTTCGRGSVVVVPGAVSHFYWARSDEFIMQMTAVGPIAVEYVDPEHDPRERDS